MGSMLYRCTPKKKNRLEFKQEVFVYQIYSQKQKETVYDTQSLEIFKNDLYLLHGSWVSTGIRDIRSFPVFNNTGTIPKKGEEDCELRK